MNSNRRLFLLAAACAGALSVWGGKADLESAVRRTEARTFACRSGNVFRYRWAERKAPAPDARRPVVFFLHGAGERGTNNVDQLVHGARELLDWLEAHERGFVFVAGQVPKGLRWVEVDWSAKTGMMPAEPSATMAAQFEFAERLFADDPTIDRKRVYVTGLSMGGYGTWDALSRHPDWFAAALPICGGGDPAQAAAFAKVPVWAFHGSADTAVPVCRSRAMVSALWAAGSNAHYREYPDNGHGIWTRTYRDPEVLKWFFAQRR